MVVTGTTICPGGKADFGNEDSISIAAIAVVMVVTRAVRLLEVPAIRARATSRSTRSPWTRGARWTIRFCLHRPKKQRCTTSRTSLQYRSPSRTSRTRGSTRVPVSPRTTRVSATGPSSRTAPSNPFETRKH